jgi:hypothetical protein
MFLTGKHLSRRALLRGTGAAVALPLLDAMLPAGRTATRPRSRLVCIEMVHGAAGSAEQAYGKHYWSPPQEGTGVPFSYSLDPLAPLREYVTIVSGTDARQADAFSPSEAGADHFRSSAVFLTAAHPKQTAGADVAGGVSIDQLYARQFGQDTPLPSIQLAIESSDPTDSCGFQYSCVYSNAISWESPTRPLRGVLNARVVFEMLFGDRSLAARALRAQRQRQPGTSILDGVANDAGRLRRAVGATDRRTLDAFLTDIRAVERRIEAVERRNAISEQRELAGSPLGVPDSWQEHVELMFDLQVLALGAEVTRVSSFKLSRDTSNRLFPESGVRRPFHTLSHHGQRPEDVAEFARLNRYHVGVVAAFLEKLRRTPDGDGNLLDHSLVLYGSPMGDSYTHNHRRVPLFLAGHASGAIRGNLHRVCPDGTPHANALLTVLRRLGVAVGQVGDSTGEITI